MEYLGDYQEDSVVYYHLSTNAASGGAVAPSSAFEAADFRIYKDGSAAQKTSTNGIAITSPFDLLTGVHLLEIDTSIDTGDAGFWQSGHDYTVVAVPDETVDGQTVEKPLVRFSIENRCVNWAKVRGATTTVNLTGTTIQSVEEGVLLDPDAVDLILAPIQVLVDVILARIGAFTGLVSNSILGYLTAIMSKVASTPTQVGGTFNAAAHSIEAIADNAGVVDEEAIADAVDVQLTSTHGQGPWNNSGVGPHQLLLTFVDENGPLEGVLVAVKINGITLAFATTNADGLAELNVAAIGTYRVAASLTGYYFEGADLVVAGDEEEEYEMIPLNSVLTQTDLRLITGWLYCYNEEHELAAGIKVTGKLTQSNQGDGTTWSEREFTMTSSSGPLGLITRGFLRGAVYQFNRGVGGTVEQTVPLTGDSFPLDESIGLP